MDWKLLLLSALWALMITIFLKGIFGLIKSDRALRRDKRRLAIIKKIQYYHWKATSYMVMLNDDSYTSNLSLDRIKELCNKASYYIDKRNELINKSEWLNKKMHGSD